MYIYLAIFYLYDIIIIERYYYLTVTIGTSEEH